ncbi:hypothetical protein [Roseateles violae]|uniref:SPOR domain-containing protein n=1 Tax=Roseateles violae TaxID=3058042 RepID=A0ABT8DV86_9BURK|nr:hypothetical protein [Pelomonas sp. PFR6]MDN3922117.1 hypothetical protein [Pelomonas sp. PFR6]
MDRLPEQVVAWHNRHPLAKRISIYDVHTIGIVALPFMRSGRVAAAMGSIEPTLSEEISAESLAAAWDEESTVAAHPNAAHLDALADQEIPPGGSWRERLASSLRRFGLRAPEVWPAFSERFVDGLSARRIAGFAERHGHASRPGDAAWPQRDIAIDDRLLAGRADGGAWPFELYLMSAAIDAGASRSRVLVGRAQPRRPDRPSIIGRRCLSPLRVGIVALVLLAPAAMAGLALWPRAADEPGGQLLAAATPAPAPASAPARKAQLASTAAAARASDASAAASVASAPSPNPIAAAASAAASAPEPSAVAAATAPPPDIRPHLLAPPVTAPASAAPLHAAAASAPPAASVAPPFASTAVAAASAPASAPPERLATTLPIKPAVQLAAQSGKPVVALVGPPKAGKSGKAEAEALLAKMRGTVAPTQLDPAGLQAQVFETPEGWRAAIWPFASREEAQLINATLVARGLKTKAVNF